MPLMKMSEHLKAIADMPPLKWNTKLEDAVEEYFDLTEEEKAWELPDRLESSGISREVLCADMGHGMHGAINPIDTLMNLI